ncbi:TonB-dependent receptor [Photorhabdus temperata]|uniref:Outer membrane receptor protein n=1 Tax=Photorhabdus temperata subsp. temperata Meg1 TaxID=1393735 RepID=A0A081RW40_PHOTE|nr:TonB-dependent receptor [Photorhabdus temperata]KER02893.1 outer membrane receptor protein [Photorhabdus temperata subsp. temperata Meg1]MCT8347603.1 TonB-dependent receptor [Photorhabdus temperata]
MHKLNNKYSKITLVMVLTYSMIPYRVDADTPKQPAENKADLGKINVSATSEKDQAGYDAVYDKDITNIYLGKDLVERYKGASPADVLKSAVGVFSGDSRNSGALDPNIRGIQGQGRVPVTIDGTEQAITTWRGYNGANNRNYIDPNLISSIEIEKGPSLTRGVKGSIGGAVIIKTLGIDDVVPADERFGINLKLETSSNAVKERAPNLQLGQDYRDIPGFTKGFNYVDPALEITPKTSKDNKLLGLKDNAIRLAIGTRQEYFDLMAAYSYRSKGNYFAGKGGAHRYDAPISDKDKDILEGGTRAYDPYLPFVARIYRPGNEVPNTSSEMESWLLKNTWRLANQQTIGFGIRDTKTIYGEIMPSRLGWVRAEDNVVPQWPLANVHQQAFNVDYKWKPDENKWVDFDMKFWITRTISNTNTAGGYPREPRDRDEVWDKNQQKRDPSKDGRLVDTAATNAHNNRWGVDLSNAFALTANLDLTLSANLQRERLGSHDDYEAKSFSNFRSLPRKGRRQENNIAFNFDWRPTSWLALSAGAKRVSYWSKDDFLNERLAARDLRYSKDKKQIGMGLQYMRTLTEREAELLKKFNECFECLTDDEFNEYSEKIFSESKERDSISRPMIPVDVLWQYRDDGKLYKQDNPYFNGELDMNERVIDPMTNQEVYKYEYSDAQSNSRYIDSSGEILSNGDGGLVYKQKSEQERWSKQPKRKDYAWAPVFSATAYVSDNVRIYARYAEAVRMPSIFEDTVGFSSGFTDKPARAFKPERSKTVEVGYVHDLSQLLGAEHNADIKFAYYNTVIENVFDRDSNFKFTQLDKQKLSGLEVQGRYDNGGFFTQFGLSYNLKNKVCDKTSAGMLDSTNQFGVPECIDGGFPGGFLRTTIPPRYSLNLNIGGRLLDEDLEIGSRVLYHSSVENKDEKWLMKKMPGTYKGINNNPMRWNPVMTVDAYINYKVAPNVVVELSGTNLTDRYYLDPLTRSMMPAPGRTFKLSVTSQF